MSFAAVCDACDKEIGSFFCTADGAFLCTRCDVQIHSNRIAMRHVRVPYTQCPPWAYREAKAKGRLREGVTPPGPPPPMPSLPLPSNPGSLDDLPPPSSASRGLPWAGQPPAAHSMPTGGLLAGAGPSDWSSAQQHSDATDPFTSFPQHSSMFGGPGTAPGTAPASASCLPLQGSSAGTSQMQGPGAVLGPGQARGMPVGSSDMLPSLLQPPMPSSMPVPMHGNDVGQPGGSQHGSVNHHLASLLEEFRLPDGSHDDLLLDLPSSPPSVGHSSMLAMPHAATATADSHAMPEPRMHGGYQLSGSLKSTATDLASSVAVADHNTLMDTQPMMLGGGFGQRQPGNATTSSNSMHGHGNQQASRSGNPAMGHAPAPPFVNSNSFHRSNSGVSDNMHAGSQQLGSMTGSMTSMAANYMQAGHTPPVQPPQLLPPGSTAAAPGAGPAGQASSNPVPITGGSLHGARGNGSLPCMAGSTVLPTFSAGGQELLTRNLLGGGSADEEQLRAMARLASSEPQGGLKPGSLTASLCTPDSSMHGGNLLGGSLHGANLLGGSLHGGSLLSATVHGGSLVGGSVHGGSMHGANLIGGSMHGAGYWAAAAALASMQAQQQLQQQQQQLLQQQSAGGGGAGSAALLGTSAPASSTLPSSLLASVASASSKLELPFRPSSLFIEAASAASIEARARALINSASRSQQQNVHDPNMVMRIERPDGTFKELDPERAAQLHRYRQKRAARMKAYAEGQRKGVRYECRKQLADTRLRVRGRFAPGPASSQQGGLSESIAAAARSFSMGSADLEHCMRGANAYALLMRERRIDEEGGPGSQAGAPPQITPGGSAGGSLDQEGLNQAAAALMRRAMSCQSMLSLGGGDVASLLGLAPTAPAAAVQRGQHQPQQEQQQQQLLQPRPSSNHTNSAGGGSARSTGSPHLAAAGGGSGSAASGGNPGQQPCASVSTPASGVPSAGSPCLGSSSMGRQRPMLGSAGAHMGHAGAGMTGLGLQLDAAIAAACQQQCMTITDQELAALGSSLMMPEPVQAVSHQAGSESSAGSVSALAAMQQQQQQQQQQLQPPQQQQQHSTGTASTPSAHVMEQACPAAQPPFYQGTAGLHSPAGGMGSPMHQDERHDMAAAYNDMCIDVYPGDDFGDPQVSDMLAELLQEQAPLPPGFAL